MARNCPFMCWCAVKKLLSINTSLLPLPVLCICCVWKKWYWCTGETVRGIARGCYGAVSCWIRSWRR